MNEYKNYETKAYIMKIIEDIADKIIWRTIGIYTKVWLSSTSKVERSNPLITFVIYF